MNHHDAVGGGVYVQLDGIGTEFQGSLEGRKGVIGKVAWSAAMANPFGLCRG